MTLLPSLTVLRGSGESIGAYLRPGRNDHLVLTQALIEGKRVTGIVLEPGLEARHREMRIEAHDRGVETILDSLTLELATVGGVERSGPRTTPWATARPSGVEDLAGDRGKDYVRRIIDFLGERQFFSAVLTPSHFLVGSSDWFSTDLRLANLMREELTRTGVHALLYYRLAGPSSLLRDSVRMRGIIAGLRSIDVDAIWLRLHPFGTTSAGPVALRGYVETTLALHELGLPVVGERTGTVGLALSAFGAVGGVESGVTFGEGFDATDLLRRPAKGSEPFAPGPRVYIADLGALVSRAQARTLFAHKHLRVTLGCKDEVCCPRGVEDTLADPRRHFLSQRTRELRRLGNVPAEKRLDLYMDEFLRPASDRAVMAAKIAPVLDSVRRRLESLRVSLAALRESHAARSYSKAAVGRRINRHNALGPISALGS